MIKRERRELAICLIIFYNNYLIIWRPYPKYFIKPLLKFRFLLITRLNASSSRREGKKKNEKIPNYNNLTSLE